MRGSEFKIYMINMVMGLVYKTDRMQEQMISVKRAIKFCQKNKKRMSEIKSPARI